MTEVNIPLLRKEVEWVEEQSELDWSKRQWSQSNWIRDNGDFHRALDQAVQEMDLAQSWDAFLVSSRTAMQTANARERAVEIMSSSEFNFCKSSFCMAGHTVLTYGTPEQIKRCLFNQYLFQRVANEILGLTGLAHGLYHESNSAEEIRRKAELVAGEKL